MARDSNRLLTSVRQIALVKIAFIFKRATIRVETIVVWYVNSKLLQLVKHSFFCCCKHLQHRYVSLEHRKHMAMKIIRGPKLTAARALVPSTVFRHVENITKV